MDNPGFKQSISITNVWIVGVLWLKDDASIKDICKLGNS